MSYPRLPNQSPCHIVSVLVAQNETTLTLSTCNDEILSLITRLISHTVWSGGQTIRLSKIRRAREIWSWITQHPGSSLFLMLWDKAIPPQKKLRHCCGVFPVLRNVPLPFWLLSTFPNTIFGIRGVEASRRRVRVALAYYVNVIKQTSPGTKTIHRSIHHQKRAHTHTQMNCLQDNRQSLWQTDTSRNDCCLTEQDL